MIIKIFVLTTRLLSTFLTVAAEFIPCGRCFLDRGQWPVVQPHSGDPGINGRRSHKSCRWTTEGLWVPLFGRMNLWWWNCLIAVHATAVWIYRMHVYVCEYICSVCLGAYTNWVNTWGRSQYDIFVWFMYFRMLSYIVSLTFDDKSQNALNTMGCCCWGAGMISI